MELLVPIAVIAGAIWFAIYWKHSSRLDGAVLPVGVAVLLLVQAILGPEFFSLHAGPIPITLDRVLLGGLLLVALRKFVTRPAGSHWINWLDMAVLAWIVVLTASTFLHDFGFRNNLPVTRLLFFNLMPLVLYFVVRQIEWTPGRLDLLQWCVIGLGAYLAATGICEWRGWHGLVFPKHIINSPIVEFYGRARGPLLNPVINGMLINAAIATLLAMAWRKGPTVSLLSAVLIPLMMAGSYATLTRSVWVGTALTTGILILAPLTARARVVVCVSGLALVGLIVGAFGDELNRFKRDRDVSVEEMAQSAELRPILATVALEMFRDRPVQGFGFGQYSNTKRPYHYLEHDGMPLTMALPYMQHNVVLSYATETGLLGVVVLIGMLFAGTVLSWQLWRVENNSMVVRHQSLITLTIVGNYLVNGMFHDVSIVPMCHSHLLLYLGIVSMLTIQWNQKACMQPAMWTGNLDVEREGSGSVLARPLTRHGSQ